MKDKELAILFGITTVVAAATAAYFGVQNNKARKAIDAAGMKISEDGKLVTK